MPKDTNENDNATMAALYNRLDCLAEALGCAIVLIHHCTKGDQSAKAITDVGAGAGAQSRATDTHLVLRAHEEDKVVVLDAAVRSWPPITPLCLRWDFPLWTPAADLDPTKLRKPQRRSPKPTGNAQEPPKATEPWTAKRFAEALGKTEPRPKGVILEGAIMLGLANRKAEQLLQNAVDCGYLHMWRAEGQANRSLYSTAPKPVPAPPPDAVPHQEKKKPGRKRNK